MKKLNVGSGFDYKKGWINVDISKQVRTDKRFDLNKLPYLYKDNSIDEIYCKDVIEHLTLKPILFLAECRRLLKRNGTLRLIFPNMFQWRLRLKYLNGSISWDNTWSAEHFMLIKPSWVIIALRMLDFNVKINHINKGFTGWFFKNNIDLRENIIDLECRKRGGI